MNGKLIKILHLSDLHIGCNIGSIKHKLWENGNEVKTEKQFLVTKSLFVQKFSEQIIKKKQKPDFIIITGDFVLSGENEFEHRVAFENLSEFCKNIGFTDPNKIFIVPGNHDLCRKSCTKNNRQDIMKYHVDHTNKFYSSLAEVGKIDSTEMLYKIDDYYETETFKNKKQKIVYSDNDCSFIPLQSQLNAYKHKPNFYSKNIFNRKKNYWKFDRGHIEKNQIEEIGDIDTKINITFFHHNPLPIERKGHNYTDAYLRDPEFNFLSNGPEIINTLISKGINIIFHGHRHQKSIIKYKNNSGDECAIIGAPSCGHDEESTPYLGYNYVEINTDSFSIKIDVTTEKYFPTGEWMEQAEKIKVILKDKLNSPFLNFQEGVEKLSKNVLDVNSKGVTVLHYYKDTIWRDFYDIVFSPLIKKTQKGTKIFNSLFSLSGETFTGLEKMSYKKAIQDTIDKNILNQSLVDFFMNSSFIVNLYKFVKSGTRSENDFLNHIIDLMASDNHKSRSANYFIEYLRCSTQSDYHIHKCVYFNSNPTKDSDKVLVKRKFEWLIKSIIAAKSTKSNLCFSWLPYNISGLNGESLIEINYTAGANILFGYSYKSDDKKSVLYIDNELDQIETEGRLVINKIRPLAQKIIKPLSYYVLNCFSLYNGKLNIDNLEYVATKFKIDNWETYKTQLNEIFTGNIESSNRNIISDLIGLRHWVHGILRIEEQTLNEIEKLIDKIDNDTKAMFSPWMQTDIEKILS